ncbi:unnamed protein product [Rhodiola kirilowii]
MPGKLRSRWTGPNTATKVFNHGALELENPTIGNRFKVNGQRMKHYQGKVELPVQQFDLAEPPIEI